MTLRKWCIHMWLRRSSFVRVPDPDDLIIHYASTVQQKSQIVFEFNLIIFKSFTRIKARCSYSHTVWKTDQILRFYKGTEIPVHGNAADVCFCPSGYGLS